MVGAPARVASKNQRERVMKQPTLLAEMRAQVARNLRSAKVDKISRHTGSMTLCVMPATFSKSTQRAFPMSILMISSINLATSRNRTLSNPPKPCLQPAEDTSRHGNPAHNPSGSSGKSRALTALTSPRSGALSTTPSFILALMTSHVGGSCSTYATVRKYSRKPRCNPKHPENTSNTVLLVSSGLCHIFNVLWDSRKGSTLVQPSGRPHKYSAKLGETTVRCTHARPTPNRCTLANLRHAGKSYFVRSVRTTGAR